MAWFAVLINNLAPIHSIIKFGGPFQLFQHFKATRDHKLPTTDIQKIVQEIVHRQKIFVHSVESSLNVTSERLHRTDMESRFNVRYIPDNEFPPHIKHLIKNHGFKQIFDRKNVFREVNGWILRHDDIMEQELSGDLLTIDRRFYIKWINKSVGYGVFTSVNIEAWNVLGVYSGQLRCGPTFSLHYAWRYMDLKDGNQRCRINARNAGNLMRFVNDNGENSTAVVTLGEYQNQFYWLYLAHRPITKNQQVSVDYGVEYWTESFLPYKRELE